MSFVFVSHASQDKPAIRHIVDALIADGHKVWLDNPATMNYTPEEVRAHFCRLSADKRWQEEIDDALAAADAVLVCFSRRFTETRRNMWHDEVALARQSKKLVACRIDGLDTSALPINYATLQMPDLSRGREPGELATALALIVDDVRRKLGEVAASRLANVRQSRRDQFSPYLVDRTEQEDAIGTALEAIASDGGVKAFFLTGPENECLDEFLDRLQRYSCAARLGEGRSWHRTIVEWPGGESSGDFAAAYQRRLARELKIPAKSSDAELASALARQGRPVAVLSLLTASEWHADEDRRVGAWLEMWRRLSEQKQRFAALPILCLKMPAAKPGWRPAPSGTAPGGAMSNAAIWRAVTRLQRKPGWIARMLGRARERAPLGAPPILHPVTKSHADQWMWNSAVVEQLASDKEKAVARIEELFAVRGASRHGLALKDFATGMLPIFRAGS